MSEMLRGACCVGRACTLFGGLLRAPSWVCGRWCGLGLLALLLVACGGPPQAEATPIPASVARPAQSTPAYPAKANVFTIVTPQGTPVFVPTSAPEPVSTPMPGDRRVMVNLLLRLQTPSGIGIATGGGAIYATPGGRVLTGIPLGGIVTVTGKSADEAWYTVYNEDAVFGWTPAGQLRVYGSENLLVLEQAPDPGPVATLLADANVSVRVLDTLLATLEARPSPALTPSAAPAVVALLFTPTPAVAGANGVVISESRLNVRTAPATAATLLTKLPPDTPVLVTGRTSAGDWLQVQVDGGAGWVAAEFVQLDNPGAELPAINAP